MAIGNGSKLLRVEINQESYTMDFYFEGSDEPFNVAEFIPRSPTHTKLRAIELAIINFNANGGVR